MNYNLQTSVPLWGLVSGWRRHPILVLISFIAMLIGFCLLSLTIQLWFDVQSVLEPRTGDGNSEVIILSRSLGGIAALDSSRASFRPQDIDIIAHSPLIKDYAAVQGNQFRAGLIIKLGPEAFGTQLFLESLPEKWLQPVPQAFYWNDVTQSIPILIPREFLGLYNLGFAPSRGLPIIQESMLALLPVQLQISNGSIEKRFDAKIVGTTDRITSILVPDSFMTWANAHYAVPNQNQSTLGPRRILIRVDDGANPKLDALFQSQSWQSESATRGLRETTVLITAIFSGIGLVALLILGLSLMVFFLIIRIWLGESGQDLLILKELGYKPSLIALLTAIGGLLPAMIAIVLALITANLGSNLFQHFLVQRFGLANTGLHVLIPIILIVITILIFVVQFMTIRRDLDKADTMSETINKPLWGKEVL